MTSARFVDLTERILYLRTIPVGAELPPTVLRIIASYLRERSFSAGTALMREGEPFKALELLTEGRLGLVRKGNPFGTLAPPQSLGFLAILAGTDGSYDATAEVDCRSLSLDADALLELLEDHGEFFHATFRYLADRLLYEIIELPAELLGQRFASHGKGEHERNLDTIDRILFLRSLRAFARANLNVLAELAQHFEEIQLEPGESFWRIGEPSDYSLYLLSGEVESVTAEGKTWRSGARSVIGGVESIVSKPRWFNLSAATPVAALRQPAGPFVDLLEDDFATGMGFISLFARQLIDLLERKAAMGQSTVSVKRNVSKLGAVPVGA